MSVIVLYPGYLTGPQHMASMKERLEAEGHIVENWTLGYNTGMSTSVFVSLHKQLEKLHEHYGVRITIIGHSLGGSIGRAMGNISTECVEQVITIGSPINNVRDALDKFKTLLDMRNGKITNAEEWEQYKDIICIPPRVKCTSIWSTEDKVVPWRESLIEASDGTNITVEGKHLKLPQMTEVQDIVTKLLVEQLPGHTYNIRT